MIVLRFLRLMLIIEPQRGTAVGYQSSGCLKDKSSWRTPVISPPTLRRGEVRRVSSAEKWRSIVSAVAK